MKGLRAVRMAIVLSGLAGLATAQPLITVSSSPASPTAGQPFTLVAVLTGNDNCGGDTVSADIEGPPPGISIEATAFTTTVPPVPQICLANLPNSGLIAGGTHTAVAKDETANVTSGVYTFVVNPAPSILSLTTSPDPSTYGQTVTLTATVSYSGPGEPVSPPTGTVTFNDGLGTPVTASLSNSQVRVGISAYPPGTFTLQATYSGDSNYLGSSSTLVTQTINPAATTTSLQATPTSLSPGQPVALIATVSPATATGTVTFLDGSSSIGTAALNLGTASLTGSVLAGGSHSLTASYGGDIGDTPSVSPGITVSVGLKPTTTTLTAAPNPSTAGQKVTLTATVTPGNPTGTVSFFDGANLLGTASVASGVAAFSTTTLSTGSHSLTATYNGDTNNGTSTSSAVNESVTGGTAAVTLGPVSVSPSSGGGSSQVMIFTFNDASGWQDLGVVNVLINNVLDGRNACYLAYSRSAGVLYLVEDNGGTLSTGLMLGGAGSVSNSQCIVSGAASSASGSGNTLTVTLNIIFIPGFGGNKVVYMAAGDVAGANSGWQALGVWQPPFTPSGTIAVVSLTQARSAAASGTPQTFTAMLTDSQGAGDFGVVNLLVNNFIDGRSACYLAYVAFTNTLLLVDDGGDAGGPFAGSMVLNGGAGAIQNSQCSVNGAGSSAAKSGDTLALMLNITFKSPFAGDRIMWVAGRDQASGNNTDWQSMGTTTVQ